MTAHYGLTRKQKNTLIYIEAYLDEHDGVAPTYDEIKDGSGLSSKSETSRIVNALKRKGWVDYLPHHARSLRIVRPSAEKCPHCGGPI